jgi:hypothetical protein
LIPPFGFGFVFWGFVFLGRVLLGFLLGRVLLGFVLVLDLFWVWYCLSFLVLYFDFWLKYKDFTIIVINEHNFRNNTGNTKKREKVFHIRNWSSRRSRQRKDRDSFEKNIQVQRVYCK